MMKIRELRNQLCLVLAFIVTMGAVVLSTSATSRASDVGVRMGYYFDAEALSLGMELLTSLNEDTSGEWYFNPNVELAMGDHTDLAALNADFHYDFNTNSNTAVWVGAGPALLIIDRDFTDDTEVNPALDLLLGLGAKTGTYRPFIQGKGILSDNSEAALAVGIRF
jgi:hypothetical protein